MKNLYIILENETNDQKSYNLIKNSAINKNINVIPIFSSITKYCVRVDNINNFYSELSKCVSIANSGDHR